MKNQVKSIIKKSVDISGWYNSIIEQAALAQHGPVKGTMIWRPKGFAIWENIQHIFDAKIKEMGVDNVYFPLFIPYSFLEKEKSHVKGFSPELAVVTHAGGEKLAEPLVVRPTSETIMYDSFSKWIHSYKDLPLKINQWCNVVRWEKRAYYFLRTSEFLWQEGHTAHETYEDAQNMVDKALEAYVNFYQEDLALYGYFGRKSESEKFAGADTSYSYETLMPDGKVVQSCTSHNLGQNFAKAFDVKFQAEDGSLNYVYQTSWGLSARAIGAMILAHGDDNGLVLPPKIAPIQAIIIPIINKNADKEAIVEATEEVFANLKKAGIRVKLDTQDQTTGWKLNQYDLEGVPVRLEIGTKELENKTAKVVLRHNKKTLAISFINISDKIQNLLNEMQKEMLENSKDFTLKNTFDVKSYNEFKEIMSTNKGFIKAFWCENSECEAKIKEETKATTRVLPHNAKKESGICVYCGKQAYYKWLFAQAY